MTTKKTARPSGAELFLTAIHLAGLGVLGTAAFGIFTGLFLAGVGSIPAFGFGLIILVGLVYALYGVAWFETERANSLYGLAVSPLQLARQREAGFKGYLKSLGRQLADGRMWRALASFSLWTIGGLMLLGLAQALVRAAFLLLAPLHGQATYWISSFGTVSTTTAAILGLVTVGLCALGICVIVAVARPLTEAIIVLPTRQVLNQEVAAKAVQREGAVRAADLERTRIERDLHDGVQPRLVSVGMTLGLAQQKIDSDPEKAKELVGEAHTSTKAAITELRQLARGIHASVLDDRGLDAALSALAGRSHIPVRLDVRMTGRPEVSQGVFRDAEAAVYFSIAESLTNAAKHSRAAECRVTVRLRDPGTPAATLWARIEDNGIGGAHITPGGGLDGIANRVLAAGGTYRFDSPQGGPTSLEVNVPCAF